MKTILIKKSKGEQAHTDYYKKLAAQKFNVPYEQVTDLMRQTVKASELAKSYNMEHPSAFYANNFKELFRVHDEVVVTDYSALERRVGMSPVLGMPYGTNPPGHLL